MEPRPVRIFVAMPGSTMGQRARWSDIEDIKLRLLQPAADRIGEKLGRPTELVIEKDKLVSGPIHPSMFREAVESDVYIADLSGANPNVYLELGVRWALRDGITILVSQDINEDVKFNVSANRVIRYGPMPAELDRAITRIVATAIDGLRDPVRIDSPVRSTLPPAGAVRADGAGRAQKGPASLEDAGILESFHNRRAALDRFNPQLRSAQRVVVVGSSLKGLIHPGGAHQETRTILKERIGRQRQDADGLMTTDFVLTHPAFADLRAEQERRAKQDIGREVIKSLMILKDWEIEPGSVHLYLGTPTCFGILADDMMILNPYPYADVAFQSPCLLLDGGGYFFKAFAMSHFAVLDQMMVVRLSDFGADIGDLYVNLGIFKERTEELLGTARESTSRAGSVREADGDLESMDGFLEIANSALDRRRTFPGAMRRLGIETPPETSAQAEPD